MVFERFTERARQAIVLAQEEARTLGHNYIGTEHLLLGLLRVEEGLAARVLESLGISLEGVRAQIARMVGSTQDEVTEGQIPFTPRSKRVLEISLREGLALGHTYIGTEHLLLGLVRDNEGLATRILLHFDVDAATVRDAVIRALPPGAGEGADMAATLRRVGDVSFSARPDRGLRRLLMAAAGRALTAGRSEFGLEDLMAVADEREDERAADERQDPESPDT
jgi:ATP-dependent Clp protease ATP-binding subunit ClpC